MAKPLNMMNAYKTVKILIGIPSNGYWNADFGRCLCNLITACYTHRIENYKSSEIHTMLVQGSILSKSRYIIVQEAIQKEMDYLLFVDSDQTFPRKALHLLIHRDVDVIGANIATKQIPAQPTARSWKEGDPPYGMLVYTDTDSTGIQEVWRVGCGLLLLSRKALLALEPDSFDTYWRKDVESHQGEDWSMCDTLKQKGFRIYVDHDLSKEVGHLGLYEFTHNVVGELMTPEQKKAYDEEQEKLKAVG